MAITLQTVLPSQILPPAPSPNAASPNPGIRSAITQFIPASPDASIDDGGLPTPSQELNLNGFAGPSKHARGPSSSSQGSAKSPVVAVTPLGRKSMSAGAGSRRGIAHSSKILGVDKNKEAYALSQLTNGKVDVSFEGTLGQTTLSATRKGKGKGRANDDVEDDNMALFDVDLEAGHSPAAASSSRAGRLLQSMPWKKSSKEPPYTTSTVGAHDSSRALPPEDAAPGEGSRDDSLDIVRPPRRGSVDGQDDYSREEEALGAFDDDEAQLLYGGVEDQARPGYFAPGDRTFAYNSLQDASGIDGYGGAVGFERLTWRENGWMVLSGTLVAVLVLVAILISHDVIDWPGDGLGKI